MLIKILFCVPGPPPEPILSAVPEERAGPRTTSYLQLPQLPEGQRKALYPLNFNLLWLRQKTKALTTNTAICLISAVLHVKRRFLFCLFMVLCFLFISTPLILHLFVLLRLFSTLLQGLLSMERIPVIIRFLPVLFNQLFKVLTQNDNDEVTTATTR